MSIVVSDLTKIYGTQRAVDGISFEARPGEILGFLGPNGAGKSTTMKMATTYLPPTAGSISVCGYDVVAQPMAVRERVGYLPEHNPLYLDMYVQEYLAFAASAHRMGGQQARQGIARAIELVGLGKEQHKPIRALSKGYRQRVGLAQALLHDPEVLILDEPTTGLDPNQIVEIRGVIREVSRQKTVVLSTHIMQEVQALCSRVVIIREGKIVADSPIEELRGGAEWVLRAEFEGPCPPEAFQGIAGVVQVEAQPDGRSCLVHASRDCRADLFREAAAQGWVLVGLSREQASLEAQFRRLTAQ
jgi:ABC-2 type transport system ATP-binding protein